MIAMVINPPPTIDDEFDHDEATQVERDKEPESLQRQLDHAAVVELSKRLAIVEDQLSMLRDLVRQLIERNEELTQAIRDLGVSK